jgi:hypothetical protein
MPSGQLDIFRLTTRGLERYRHAGRCSWRISRQKTTNASASRLGGKSRPPSKGAQGGPEGPCEREPQGIFVEIVGDTADEGSDGVVHAQVSRAAALPRQRAEPPHRSHRSLEHRLP